ncbi:MAG: molybdopterin cofactor-binding domain-containing protein, partial [Pseudomonadota bacterium]
GYWSCCDVGVQLNPTLVDGQTHGGIAMGIGHAMMERMVYDANKQLLSGSFMDYQIPRAGDLPMIVTDYKVTPSSANSHGMRGMGELPTIGAPAALANAVACAVEKYDIQAPFTPERLWQAIHNHDTAE